MAAHAPRGPSASPRLRARLGDVPRAPRRSARRSPVASLYAAFASGAIGVAEQSRFQVMVAAIAFGTLAGLLFGRGVRFHPSRGALLGVGLLGRLRRAGARCRSPGRSRPTRAGWRPTARSPTRWSRRWAIALGSSLPRAAERVALGYLAIATLVALYALGGKLFPWLEIPGLIDLNHTERFSRLRAPLDYWNALGAGVRDGGADGRARRRRPRRPRPRCGWPRSLALVPLLTTIALTYSRGGLLVLAAALALLIGIGPERLRLAATAAVGLAGAMPADPARVPQRRPDHRRPVGVRPQRTTACCSWPPSAGRAGDRVRAGAQAGARGRAGGAERGGRPAGEARGDGGGGRRAAGRRSRALALSDRGLTGTISARRRRVHRGQVRPPERPRARAAHQLRQPLGVVGGGGGRLRRPAGDRPRRRLVPAHPPALPRQPAPGAQRPQRAAGVPLRDRPDRRRCWRWAGWRCSARRRCESRAREGPGRERGFAVRAAGGAAGGVGAPVGRLGLGDPGGDGRSRWSSSACWRPRPRAGGPRPPAAGAGRAPGWRWPPAARCSPRWWRWPRCPRVSEDLTDEALSQAASGTPGDLREAAEKAARAKRLNPFAVAPAFAQASILERGNRPADALGVLVEAVERQPDNPAAWSRLARFQILVDDSAGALRSLREADLAGPGPAVRDAPGASTCSTTSAARPAPPARRCRRS